MSCGPCERARKLVPRAVAGKLREFERWRAETKPLFRATKRPAGATNPPHGETR